MSATLTLPTIHSNGTNGQMLAEAYETAYAALEAAVSLLREASPNGRDYYPQGPAALKAAEDEHMKRIGAIRAVMQDMETLAIHCAG
jgi:hypothetical protein